MKRLMALLAAAMLLGCEGAVLVNNRPERGAPGVDSPTPAEQPQQASGVLPSDMEDEDQAQTAGATTRPADQTVETTNTRIESHSN